MKAIVYVRYGPPDVLDPRGTLLLSSGESNGRWVGPIGRLLNAAVLSPLVSQRLVALVAKRSSKDLDAQATHRNRQPQAGDRPNLSAEERSRCDSVPRKRPRLGEDRHQRRVETRCRGTGSNRRHRVISRANRRSRRSAELPEQFERSRFNLIDVIADPMRTSLPRHSRGTLVPPHGVDGPDLNSPPKQSMQTDAVPCGSTRGQHSRGRDLPSCCVVRCRPR